MMQQSEEHLQKHLAYSDRLSDLQQWITVAMEKIESYQGANGGENTEDRIADLEVRKISWHKMLIIHFAPFRH